MRIVALISGGGSNLQSIIDSCASGAINGEVLAVISNRPDAYGLERAEAAGIARHCIDHQQFQSRAAFDTTLRECIDSYQPDLVVLAGFMRIFTVDFINHYCGRMLNIHPSLLPKFPGLNTHQRALDADVSQHGASVHFVTPALDGGPVVLQAPVNVSPDDDAVSLAARVLHHEHRIYPQVIGWFAQNRLSCDATHAWLDGQPITNPLGHNHHG